MTAMIQTSYINRKVIRLKKGRSSQIIQQFFNKKSSLRSSAYHQ